MIPIVDLYLMGTFSKADHDKIVLRSGLSFGNLSTVVKIRLDTEKGRELTAEDVIGLLLYAEQSKDLREIWFHNCPLPESIHPNSIPIRLKTSNLKVFSQNFGSCLDLHSGQWVTADDVDTITKLFSNAVTIAEHDSVSQQRSTIELLKKASRHDIPIYTLTLSMSLSHVDEGDVILRSGLRLPGLSSVYRMYILKEGGTEMTQKEVVDILLYVQQSQRINGLEFLFCLLPASIPVGSIPSDWLSKNVTVEWCPKRSGNDGYNLDLRTGDWLHDGFSMTNSMYRKEVEEFRTYWRESEWQKNRTASKRT